MKGRHLKWFHHVEKGTWTILGRKASGCRSRQSKTANKKESTGQLARTRVACPMSWPASLWCGGHAISPPVSVALQDSPEGSVGTQAEPVLLTTRVDTRCTSVRCSRFLPCLGATSQPRQHPLQEVPQQHPPRQAAVEMLPVRQGDTGTEPSIKLKQQSKCENA